MATIYCNLFQGELTTCGGYTKTLIMYLHDMEDNVIHSTNAMNITTLSNGRMEMRADFINLTEDKLFLASVSINYMHTDQMQITQNSAKVITGKYIVCYDFIESLIHELII